MSILDSLERYLSEDETFLDKLIKKFKIVIPQTRDKIIEMLADSLVKANDNEIIAIKNALSLKESSINENIFDKIRGIYDNIRIATIVVFLLLLVPKAIDAKNLLDKTIDKIEHVKKETGENIEKTKKEITHFVKQELPQAIEDETKETKEKASRIGKNLKAKAEVMGDKVKEKSGALSDTLKAKAKEKVEDITNKTKSSFKDFIKGKEQIKPKEDKKVDTRWSI